MSKKVLVIGAGMDVTEKKRGEFINEYFDEIIILKYGINFLDEFKEYLGSPTILVAPGTEWYKKTFVEELKQKYTAKFNEWWDEDKLRVARDRIYTNIKKSRIKEVWRLDRDNDENRCYPFCVPDKNVLNQKINFKVIHADKLFTAGGITLQYAVDLYGKVHYMGFDGFMKGLHYYHHLENTFSPWKDPESKEHDINQYFIIKLLERQGSLEHIDKIYE